MGWMMLTAIVVGGTIGAGAGALLLYLLWDEHRWAEFVDRFEGLFDNRLTRPLFQTAVGRWLNKKTILGYIMKEKYQKAADLAVREGLVDEAVDFLEERGRILEAGRLARRMARDQRADRNFREYIDLCLEKGRQVYAAEAAEEAGFWTEAVQLYQGLEGKPSRLKAARIAADHGMPAMAVEVFLREEALLDAMRVAEEHGQLPFALEYCRKSDNPVLHHFGADAAARDGRFDVAVAILEEHGHLHAAVRMARKGGLEEKEGALAAQIRERRAREADRSLRSGGGPFSFDFSDDVIDERELEEPS